jgi:hypothetical protein
MALSPMNRESAFFAKRHFYGMKVIRAFYHWCMWKKPFLFKAIKIPCQ